MDLATLSLIGLGLYFTLLLVFSWWTVRHQDNAGFVIGNRAVGSIPIAASMAGGFRDAVFVSFWIGMAYTFGYAPLVYIFSFFVGTLILIRIAPRVRKIAAERGYVSPAALIRDAIGPLSYRILVGIILLTALVYGGAQLFALGLVVSTVTPLPAAGVVIACAMVVGMYLWVGGYGNVIKTDVIQAVIMACMVIVPFLVPIETEDILAFESIGSMPWIELLALSIAGVVVPMAGADIWQRVLAAKNDQAIRRGMPLGAVLFFILTIGMIFLGLSLRVTAPEGGVDDGIAAVFAFSGLSMPILAGLVVVIFAMGMSTLDTHVYMFSSSMLRDVFKIDIEHNRARYIWLSRLVMATMLLVITVIALQFKGIMQAMMSVSSLYILALPLFVIAACNWLPDQKKWQDSALAAIMLIGIVGYFTLMYLGWFERGFIYTLSPTVLVSLLAAGLVLFVRYRRRQT